MTPGELTPKELAVAAGCGHRHTVKKIAADVGVSERRVYALITAIALKLGVPDGTDDRLCVGDWWRDTVPVSLSRKP